MAKSKEAGDKLRNIYFEKYNEVNHTRLGLKPTPRWDGGTGPDGRKYTRKWDKWASLIESKNLDLIDYVNAQFQRGNLISSPEDLFTEAMINSFCDVKRNSREFEQRWNTQEQILLAQIRLRERLGDSRDRAVRFVLRDRSLQVTPLVRYAFGLLNNYIVEEYRDEARAQYLKQKCWYDAQCQDRIPKEFKK